MKHNKKMNKIAIFAHYDADNQIKDYVLYYLSGLKKVVDKIIFVSDCNLTNQELSKLNNLALYTHAEKHHEYDFGSYKRGFLLAKKFNLLSDIDELILANDSCYAPLYPFENMFDKMSDKVLDFWGVTQNNIGIIKTNNKYIELYEPHIQSYFLVIKKNVFNSPCFINFMENIKLERCKQDIIIKYEIGLTKELAKNGFIYDTYINKYNNVNNPTIKKWRSLIIKDKSPFVKISVLSFHNLGIAYPYFWKRLIKSKNKKLYTIISEQHSKRLSNKFALLQHFVSSFNILRKKMIKFYFKNWGVYLIDFWFEFFKIK